MAYLGWCWVEGDASGISRVAQEQKVKEASAGRLDRAFGRENLGCSGIGDLKAGTTRDSGKEEES